MKKSVKLQLSKWILQAEICEGISKMHPLNLAEIVEDGLGGRVKFSQFMDKETRLYVSQDRKRLCWKGKSYIGDRGPWGYHIAIAQIIEENKDDLLNYLERQEKK